MPSRTERVSVGTPPKHAEPGAQIPPSSPSTDAVFYAAHRDRLTPSRDGCRDKYRHRCIKPSQSAAEIDKDIPRKIQPEQSEVRDGQARWQDAQFVFIRQNKVGIKHTPQLISIAAMLRRATGHPKADVSVGFSRASRIWTTP
jgi:hypothetical protein